MFSPKVLQGAAAPHSIFCSPASAVRKASSHQAYFKRTAKGGFVLFPSLSTHTCCVWDTHPGQLVAVQVPLSGNIWGGGKLKAPSSVLLALAGSGQPPCWRHRNQWKWRTKLGHHFPESYSFARCETQEWGGSDLGVLESDHGRKFQSPSPFRLS